MFNIFSTYVLKKQSKQQQEKIDNEVDEISKALSNVNLNSDIVNLMDLLADGNNANAAGAAGGDGGGGAIVNVAAPNVNNVAAGAAGGDGGGGAIVNVAAPNVNNV